MSQSSVRSVSYNESHNIATWDRPHTLDITNVEPDIYGYTVCTVISLSSAAVEECTDVTNNSFIIAKYSVVVHVKVTADNIVGKSNQVVYTIEPCIQSGKCGNVLLYCLF